MSNLEISFINFVVHSSILLFLVLLINRFIKQEYLQLRSLFLKLTLCLLFLLPIYSWFVPEKIKALELPSLTTDITLISTSLTLDNVQLPVQKVKTDTRREPDIQQQSSWKIFKFNFLVFVFIGISIILLIKEIFSYKFLLRNLKGLPEVKLPQSTLFKKVRYSKQFKSPFMVGFKEPLLVLPLELVDEDPVVLRSILVHEEEHLKNGDNRVAVYERILFCIYYWSPLYWLFQKTNSEVQELLADTAVLKEVKSKIYAGILLKLAVQQSTVEKVNSAALTISSSVNYKRIKKIISQGKKLNIKPSALKKALWSILFVGVCIMAISAQCIEKEKSVYYSKSKEKTDNKESKEETTKNLLNFKGKFQLPEEYQSKIDLSEISYYLFSNKKTQTFKLQKDGSFELQSDLKNNPRVWVHYFDRYSQNLITSKTVNFSKESSQIKLKVIPQSMAKTPITVAGKLKIPEEFKGKIDLSRVMVTLQQFPTRISTHSFAGKDGSFRLVSELNGLVGVYVYIIDHVSQNLLRVKKEIRLKDQDITLKPLELEVIPQLTTGSLAPDFNTRDIHGESVKLSDFRGKVVLLNFYSTSFPGSIAQRPHIDAMSKKYGNTNQFVVIGVSRDQNKETVLNYFKKEKLDWVSVFDGPDLNKGISRTFGVVDYPKLFLIGPNGEILNRDIYGKSIETVVNKAMKDLIADR